MSLLYVLLYIISVAIVTAIFWWVITHDVGRVTRGDLLIVGLVCLSGPFTLLLFACAAVFMVSLYGIAVLHEQYGIYFDRFNPFNKLGKWLGGEVYIAGRKWSARPADDE